MNTSFNSQNSQNIARSEKSFADQTSMKADMALAKTSSFFKINASKRRVKEFYLGNDFNIGHSISYKGSSAEKNQEVEQASVSYVSAAEYLSGDSGDYNDEYFQADDLNHDFKSPEPRLESQMVLGLSKSSQVMNVLGSRSNFDRKSKKGDDPEIIYETKSEKKFLALPSFMAGICLGLNNFLLGLISDQGISGAYIFSVGAINFAASFKLLKALHQKKKTGKYWSVEDSNLFCLQEQNLQDKLLDAPKRVVVNWMNVLGLILRVSVNITFQSTTMLAFMFAQKAGIN